MTRRAELEAALNSLAPLGLSEAWDNTGWIIDVNPEDEFTSALCTIDLSEGVIAEARSAGADLIIAYHPPIFSGLKRLRHSHPDESLLVRLIEAQLSVYSPHTALDASAGGMAEWLAGALGPGVMRPIVPSVGDARVGAGRIIELDEEVELAGAIDRIKGYLQLGSLRVSPGHDSSRWIRTMAVCPGAGGSLFERVAHADLLLTGEMRHHDVLWRARRGTHVILTDHTNCERGYLPRLASRLTGMLPGLVVSVSSVDSDPLRIV